MDFETQYEQMLKTQLTTLLQDFVQGKGKANKQELKAFAQVPVKYEIPFDLGQSKETDFDCEAKFVPLSRVECLPLS